MKHPYLVTLAMVALTAISWWGLMKLEAIKPKKKTKRRWAKRKRKKKKGRQWQTFMLLFYFSRRERLLGAGLISGVTWLVAVIINDLPLAVVATVALVTFHIKLQSLKQQ